jgi:hypothetical protein
VYPKYYTQDFISIKIKGSQKNHLRSKSQQAKCDTRLLTPSPPRPPPLTNDGSLRPHACPPSARDRIPRATEKRGKKTTLQFLKPMGKTDRRGRGQGATVLVRSAAGRRGGQRGHGSTRARLRRRQQRRSGGSALVPLPDLGDLDLEADEFATVLFVIRRGQSSSLVASPAAMSSGGPRGFGRKRASGKGPRGRGGGGRGQRCGAEGAGGRDRGRGRRRSQRRRRSFPC